jgi:carboxyl-terminal processing protease
LTEKKSCGFVDAWVSSHWNAALTRLWKTIDTSPLPSNFSTRPLGDEEEAPEKKWTSLAENETDLAKRVTMTLSEIAETSSAGLVKSYAGDKKLFLKDRVQDLLLDGPIRSRTLLAKALLGALDPFSTYFPGDEFEEFYNELSGGTSGIGVQVRKVPDGYYVEKVLADSAAGKSKQVLPSDIIITIDGIHLKSMPRGLAKNLFSGPPDSKVTLGLVRGAKRKFVSLTRTPFAYDEGRITSRLYHTADGEIAIVEIPSFYGRAGMHSEREERSSAEDLKTVLTKLMKRRGKLKAIVLDVRGNPGGYLEEAVTMAGYFIGSRPVVAVVEKGGKRILKEEGVAPLYKGPLVVLTDTGTASASEVLAGALKDYHRALVIGTSRTYGKGSVQKLFHLDDELVGVGGDVEEGKGVVKLTTSFFYSPLGHSPNNGGVSPHMRLTKKEEKEKAHRRLVAVPETEPSIEGASLETVQEENRSFLLRVKDLEARREEREKRRAELLKEDSLPTDEVSKIADVDLKETIQVAADHAQLEIQDRKAFSSVAE